MSTDQMSTDDANSNDGEGVWSPEIEQAFQEALLLYPPCGRRKHILQEEGGGRMYGRNELIARFIKMQTGKVRTRKQVSSHIQVLARRRAKTDGGGNSGDSLSDTPSPSSAGSLSVSRNHPQHNSKGYHNEDSSQMDEGYYDIWLDRPIVTPKIRLVEFSAFTERRIDQFLQSTNSLTGRSNLARVPAVAQSSSAATETSFANQLSSDAVDRIQVGQLSLQSPDHHNPTQFFANRHYPTHQTNQLLNSTYQIPSQFGQEAAYSIAAVAAATNQTSNQHQFTSNNLGGHPRSLGQVGSAAILQDGQSRGGTNQQQTNGHHNHHQQHLQQTSTGFTRHCYVKIDSTKAPGRQTNKLERIDISQIQDKFPEIGGLDGLFQRGPSDAFFLVKFWADINNKYDFNMDDQNSYYGFSSHFETTDSYKDITCSTKACSYGLQVVEKVDKIYGTFNNINGRYSYAVNRSPMCEFMIQFIKKLRQLPRTSQMNSVLENFSVLQVITSESTSEILLCLAYVFEVADSSDPLQNNGPQYRVYKLTKD